ncbi:MAG: helix-turn-helix domain-containing protein [Nitrospirae bacterium]|nr:helix-turn-helix domain-containing protein [Nitrospirota bacterium]
MKNEISLEELATKSGVSLDELGRIERGEVKQLDVQRLLKIADNLKLKSGVDFAGLMRLNKYPRRFHVYGVGLPKSGTVSLAGLFGNYRSSHEFHQWETHQMIIRHRHGDISRERFSGFLKEREMLGGLLEMDSAHFNRHYIDILQEEFPDAKFICLIRDCYSWVNSFVNYFVVPEREAMQSRELPNGMPFDIPRGSMEAKNELVNNFHKYIDVPLSFWASSYRVMLEKLPPGRCMLIRTHELSQKINDIADFIGVSPDTLIKERSHLNKAKYTVNILRNLDRDFLKEKFSEHCSDLMEKYFPEFSLDDILS